jgi:hypothetical protein
LFGVERECFVWEIEKKRKKTRGPFNFCRLSSLVSEFHITFRDMIANEVNEDGEAVGGREERRRR